jgi:hypothetical protein
LVPAAGEGLSLEQVSAAAEGAGIDPDFVRFALAERRLPDAENLRRERGRVRWVQRFLAHKADAIDVATIIHATPQRVLESVRSVFPKPPFELMLEDNLGDDPIKDGVLVYRLQESESESSFQSDMDIADARVLLVTIRPEGEVTRLRMRVPLFRPGINLALGTGTAGLAGAGGAWGGTTVGGALGGLIGVAAAGLVVPVMGALVGTVAGVAIYRRFFRWAIRTGESALQRLTRAVTVEAEARLPAIGEGR